MRFWNGSKRSPAARHRRHHRTRRPPCAGRGRRQATRAVARGGARGTSRRSTRRGRASATIRAFTSSSGSAASAVEVEVGPGETDHVLGLAAREAERDELVLRRARDTLARRKRVGVLGPLAEALDQAVADRERAKSETCCAVIEVTSDLERVGRERRPEAGERRREPPQRPGRRGAPSDRTRRGRTGAPSSVRTSASIARVERLDAHAAGRRLDPHLTPADDAVQAALVPEVREIGPERAEALGRELEVVRLRKAQQQRSSQVVERLVGDALLRRGKPPARAGRRSRSAASAAQRSE